MMSLMGMGFFELIIILSLNGGMGIPLGVPPAEEDPFLARIAPDECLFYTTWSAMAQPLAGSQNRTEQMLAEEEIQRALSTLESQIKAAMMHSAEKSGDPQAVLAAQLAPTWGKLLLTSTAAFFVSRVEPAPAGVDVQAGMVVRLDQRAEEVKVMLERLQQETIGDKVESIELEGSSYYQFRVQPEVPLLAWGIRDNYLIVGVGDESIQTILADARSDPPAWLTDLKKELPVRRRSTVTYLNAGSIVDLILPLIAGVDARGVADALGFGNLTSYRSITGLDETGFVKQSVLGIDGKPQGLLAAASAKPLAAEDFQSIPYDTPLATVFRLDVGKLFDAYMDFIARVAPAEVMEMLQASIEAAEGEIGFTIREQLIGSLGDVWTLYASPTDGGLLTGWTVAVQVRDRMTLAQIQDKLIDLAQAEFGDDEHQPKIKHLQFNRRDIFYLSVPDNDMPFLLSWSLTNRELVFGLYPQAVKAHLSADDKSLADQPLVAAVLQHKNAPIVVSYCDTRKLFDVLYPLAQIAAQLVINEARDKGVDIDISVLPSASAISRHLQPAISLVSRTERGIESVSHQTIPTGDIGSSIPLAIGLMLPAVTAARTAARRTQSMNNLKQVGLSLHNYHDVYGGLPPAYSTDEGGKPLLSWRVHVLPFIEEQALYDRFHHDEPWDSEHNRELIPLMPQVFRSPSSKADPGKTTYLGIAGEDKAFTAPHGDQRGKPENPTGTRFADFLDGTSNTAVVVEASDTLAVPWTKPHDYEPDDMNPLNGLIGLYPGGFNVLMGDASVRFVGEQVDKEVLKAVFQRNDHQAIELP